MDVLGAPVLRCFFAHTRDKFQDTEWQFYSVEDAIVNGRAIRLGADEQDELTHLYIVRQRRGGIDRMEWGSYRETAPPVLPGNTWVPGFENEAFSANRRYYNDLDDSESGDGDREDREQEDSALSALKEEEDTKRLGDASRNTGTRRSRDVGSSVLHSSFLPAILSNILASFHNGHGNPSSLFDGSTTRPATTTFLSRAQGSISNRTSRTISLTPTMAPRTHLWVSLWFLLSAPVIFWDAAYCFMRPRSFKGGDLHWIWKPYEIYQEVDLVYGVEAYNRGDGFTNAQSFMNIIETLLNLYYLHAQHVLASPSAPIIGFASVIMTLSKTVLYWAQEYFCGGCAVGHNDLWTLFVFWIIPNGIWLLLPSLILVRLGRDIADGLTAASKFKATKRD